MVTVGYSRLPSVYSGFQKVTECCSRLQSGDSGLQQVTAG